MTTMMLNEKSVEVCNDNTYIWQISYREWCQFSGGVEDKLNETACVLELSGQTWSCKALWDAIHQVTPTILQSEHGIRKFEDRLFCHFLASKISSEDIFCEEFCNRRDSYNDFLADCSKVFETYQITNEKWRQKVVSYFVSGKISSKVFNLWVDGKSNSEVLDLLDKLNVLVNQLVALFSLEGNPLVQKAMDKIESLKKDYFNGWKEDEQNRLSSYLSVAQEFAKRGDRKYLADVVNEALEYCNNIQRLSGDEIASFKFQLNDYVRNCERKPVLDVLSSARFAAKAGFGEEVENILTISLPKAINEISGIVGDYKSEIAQIRGDINSQCLGIMLNSLNKISKQGDLSTEERQIISQMSKWANLRLDKICVLHKSPEWRNLVIKYREDAILAEVPKK